MLPVCASIFVTLMDALWRVGWTAACCTSSPHPAVCEASLQVWAWWLCPRGGHCNWVPAAGGNSWRARRDHYVPSCCELSPASVEFSGGRNERALRRSYRARRDGHHHKQAHATRPALSSNVLRVLRIWQWLRAGLLGSTYPWPELGQQLTRRDEEEMRPAGPVPRRAASSFLSLLAPRCITSLTTAFCGLLPPPPATRKGTPQPRWPLARRFCSSPPFS